MSRTWPNLVSMGATNSPKELSLLTRAVTRFVSEHPDRQMRLPAVYQYGTTVVEVYWTRGHTRVTAKVRARNVVPATTGASTG